MIHPPETEGGFDCLRVEDVLALGAMITYGMLWMSRDMYEIYSLRKTSSHEHRHDRAIPVCRATYITLPSLIEYELLLAS